MISMRSPRIRSTVVTLAVAALVAVGTVATVARGAPATSAAAFTSAAEDDGAGCPVTLPATTTPNSQLPDPFTKLDGTRLATAADWTCRREEILRLAEQTVCGTKPAKPASVTGTVAKTGDRRRLAGFRAG